MKKFADWCWISRTKLKASCPKRPLVPLALFLLAALGVIDLRFPHKPPDTLFSLVGKKSFYDATVLTPPSPGRSGWHVRARLDTPEKTTVSLTFDSLPPLGPEDHIRFRTRFKRPAATQNPGSFNYRRFLDRQNIFLSGFVTSDGWEILQRAKSGGLKKKLEGLIDAAVPEGDSRAFLKALILGDRSGIGPPLWNDFQKTGTAHLIAISGQHVGLVAGFFFVIFVGLLKRSERLLLLFSVRKFAALFSLLPAFVYVLLAGAPPSAVRALIMLALGIASLCLHRDFEVYSTLAFAALLITLLDPAAPFGASFQLSFLAVLSLALFTPPLLKLLRVEGKTGRWKKWLAVSLAATGAATLGTAPLAAYRFHILSFSGLATNLWAIPAVGVILAVTLPSLLLGPVIPLLGTWGLAAAGYCSRIFLSWIHLSSEYSVTLAVYPTEGEVLRFYLILALAALVLHRKIRRALVVPLFAALALSFLPLGRLLPQDLKVTFIDVGQGDAALVQTPAGKNILIDGGGFLIPGKPHPFDVGKEIVVPYLKREGIRRIDLIVLSHPHPDHYGGLQAVVDSIPVGEFWWNGQRFPDETFDRLMANLPKKTALKEVRAPLATDWNDVRLEVVSPSSLLPALGINDNCLVLRLVYGETSFFLPGDIEKFAEEKIAALPGDIRSTVLKIPHHGSRTSSSVPFIDKVSPRFAVVSLADGNLFHFPHPGVLEKYERRGIQVFRTDRNGAVTFRSDGKKIRARPFIEPPDSPTGHTATQRPSFAGSREPDRPARHPRDRYRRPPTPDFPEARQCRRSPPSLPCIFQNRSPCISCRIS